MRRIITLCLLAMALVMASTDAQAQRRGQRRTAVPQAVESSEVIAAFRQHIGQDTFLAEQAMQRLNDEVSSHIERLKGDADRTAYIEANNLTQYLDAQRNALHEQQEGAQAMIKQFLSQYQGCIIVDSAACRDSLQRIVNDRLGRLETNLNLLEREMSAEAAPDSEPVNWLIIGGIAAGLLLLVIIIAALRSSRSKGSSDQRPTPNSVRRSSATPTANPAPNGAGDTGIVVRRRTATILKKQSLEDVMDSPRYLKVDLEDCCVESAVRRMYLKDQCIDDIYNMYTRDLEHPDQAREYGCMVLGRWVHDAENDEYYVSLEEVVLPGDDAVFEEYELNFGGKIKLKVHETLRRLRRDTNLQYDLTCWVHSHPGLTVFFSNSDSSVQDQLKHPQHPKFLTALVVDTLTPRMETGIFTYRRDQTLNSKNDLKKLYSLKEWHQWARQSLKKSSATPVAPVVPEAPEALAAPVAPVAPVAPAPKASSTFDLLATAKEHTTACYGVELTTDTVVDLCMALGGQQAGVVASLHGSSRKEGPVTVHTAESLADKEKVEGQQLLGSFVVAQHCSLPTIRKAVGDTLEHLKFVLVYTTANGHLTTIPVISNDLCADENYYGEQPLDDLRQWTKKGR